jgi:hypothetical protein
MSFLKNKLLFFSSIHVIPQKEVRIINASSPRKPKEMLPRDGQKSIEGSLWIFIPSKGDTCRKSIGFHHSKSQDFIWLFLGGKLQVDNFSFSSETHDGPRMYFIYMYNVHDHVDCLKPKVRSDPKMLSPFGA